VGPSKQPVPCAVQRRIRGGSTGSPVANDFEPGEQQRESVRLSTYMARPYSARQIDRAVAQTTGKGAGSGHKGRQKKVDQRGDQQDIPLQRRRRRRTSIPMTRRVRRASGKGFGSAFRRHHMGSVPRCNHTGAEADNQHHRRSIRPCAVLRAASAVSFCHQSMLSCPQRRASRPASLRSLPHEDSVVTD